MTTPAAPTVGREVRIMVLDPPPAAGAWRWYVDGRARSFTADESGPELSTTFHSAGLHAVAVRFAAAGQIHLRVIALRVSPPRHRRPNLQPSTRPGRLLRRGPRARAAGDPVVTMSDFHFGPATITVHVGDTVTWTNLGPMAHSATARDGSFNTGVIQKGHSASHTFTRPGTFAYFCEVHPFMHGTVVVLTAATAPSKAAPSSRGSSGTPPLHSATPAGAQASSPRASTPAATTAAAPATADAASGSAARPTLPTTGLNVLDSLLGAAGLLGAGLGLRGVAGRDRR